MTRNRETGGPTVEMGERYVELMDRNVDAQSAFVDAWQAGMEAQVALVNAWQKSVTAMTAWSQATEAWNAAWNGPAVRNEDREDPLALPGRTEHSRRRTDRPENARVADLERRQDAVEYKLDRILDAVER
ncbi:hypothetical protein ACFQH6_13875 [Halobacteriaceae archaeon GCM10025711]